jgi:large subunit ribosomal protein L18
MAVKDIKRNRVKKKLNYSYPVVLVNRSNQNIVAQVLEPLTKKTLFTATSSKLKEGTKTERAKKIGEQVAEFLKKQKITKAVFDRNGYLYHGRIKALADTVRESGVEM